jgi:nucleotide-binding universal stress UspA family protein
MIKDIVVCLSAGKPRDVAGDFAISVAALFRAHLTAAAFAYEPVISATPFDGVSPNIIEAWRAERRADAEKARKSFDGRAKAAGLNFDSHTFSGGAADAAEGFGVMTRNYDLAIVGQPKPDDDDSVALSLCVETALFDSGRPVLVVPYIQTAGIKLDRVMVCWDGSRNAARAIGDAMPLLERAGQIDVVTVDQTERRKDLRGAQIAEHLARHKLKVELKPIVAPDNDAANVILSQAADSLTDLIVMGAYGHSRLREFILGGATRSILDTMTVPVLMSH